VAVGKLLDRARTALDNARNTGRHAKPRAEPVLIPGRQTGHLPAETAPSFTIFEGTSEIQRMIIGRAMTGLDVRYPDLRFYAVRRGVRVGCAASGGRRDADEVSLDLGCHVASALIRALSGADEHYA